MWCIRSTSLPSLQQELQRTAHLLRPSEGSAGLLLSSRARGLLWGFSWSLLWRTWSAALPSEPKRSSLRLAASSCTGRRLPPHKHKGARSANVAVTFCMLGMLAC